MFKVKMFSNNVIRDVVFYDINVAISYFNDIKEYKLVSHARLFSHHKVIAEF